MEIEDALNHMLDAGCCLWVGAGLTAQIAGSPQNPPQWKELIPPQWDKLTSHLEAASYLITHRELDYPTRLDQCSQRLGTSAFQAFLRKTYYTDLSLILLRQAQRALQTNDFIPPEVRQVACLGQIANPIVNFNIEPLSSILLARPAGPVRLLSYTEPNKPVLTHDEPADRFRLVYHPHGLVTGSTVMTRTQYQAQSNTLAFALAVHAAFGSDLAIVGMSLEDAYLREQITRFRNGIQSIFWFNSEFPEEPAKWARSKENRIEMLPVSWPEFWNWWKDRAHKPDEGGLYAAWYRTLSEASEEVQGGEATLLARLLADAGVGSETSERLNEIAGELGEPSDQHSSEEFSGVVVDVRERIMQKGFQLPRVVTTA